MVRQGGIRERHAGTRGARARFILNVSLAGACASCNPAHSNEAPSAAAAVMQPPDVGTAREALVDPASLLVLGPDQICVTSGSVTATRSGGLSVDDPKVRAVAATMTVPVAELRFTYLGPTAEVAPLRSGAIRSQVGLKLRAQDGCNVVYVMWRIQPRQELVVSVKNNPGETRSSQCGNHGYRDVAPYRVGSLPPIEVGVPHVLHAEAQGDQLEVDVDGALVWAGTLPAEALSFDGPVGFRTDNARADLDLSTIPTDAPAPDARCRAPDDGE
jgi:hypothetical protein